MKKSSHFIKPKQATITTQTKEEIEIT